MNKTKERMEPYQSSQDEEDPDIKKIKKVKQFGFRVTIRNKEEQSERHLVCCGCAGAKFHAWLALPEEVEDHRPGLHLFPSCREHEKKKPDCLQHGGSGD